MYSIKKLKNIMTEAEDYAICIERDDGSVTWIPIDQTNADYKRFVAYLIENGVDSIDNVPDFISEQVATKKFEQQLNRYKAAVARLAQYVVAEGRPEVKEMLPSGEIVFNEETGKQEEVLVETVVQTSIEPLPATVDVWQDDEKVTVRNPDIVLDEEQRAAAQAIVDATPEEVKAAA